MTFEPYTADDLRGIPSHMHGAISRYVQHGTPPGSFLTAVLSNDLREAFAHADPINQAAMLHWVRFLYNHMPSDSHGSSSKVRAWQERKGLSGIDIEDQ